MRKSPKPRKMISINIDIEDLTSLNVLWDQNDTSVSQLIRKAIKDQIKKMEAENETN